MQRCLPGVLARRLTAAADDGREWAGGAREYGTVAHLDNLFTSPLSTLPGTAISLGYTVDLVASRCRGNQTTGGRNPELHQWLTRIKASAG